MKVIKQNKDNKNNIYVIQIRNVDKIYESDAGAFKVLDNINLNIEYSEFLIITGKSGSGKSTLLNMVTGIDSVTSGEVWIKNTPIHNLPHNKVAPWRGRNIGIVFQFFQLIPTLTIIENVMLPMDFCNMYKSRKRKSRALELLDLFGIAKQAHKLPSALSGGEQQRAAIARALANDPDIIVADEPTGNLDSHNAESILTTFSGLIKQGKTVLLVTHDLDIAKLGSRVVTIEDGEIHVSSKN